MRILAISDIHNNLSSVNKLRALETNRFDVVVAAGDMGNERAGAILQTLSTFQCPVLYVYGNWDNALDYETQFSPLAQLLHLEPVTIADVTFAGFSGCPTHWGKNPLALQTYREVDDRHDGIVAALKDAEEGARAARRAATYAHEQRLLDLQRKTKGRGSEYHDRAAVLESRHDQDIDRTWRPTQALRSLRAYRAYQKDGVAAEKGLLAQNKSALFERLTDRVIDPARLILVTHQRLGHIEEHYPGVFMHLYGHVHGFKHTLWKGTHCVNVSVLDKLELLSQAHRRRQEDSYYANAGTYTVIELSNTNTHVQSMQMQLPIDYTDWTRYQRIRTNAPLIPEEAHFGPHLHSDGNAEAAD